MPYLTVTQVEDALLAASTGSFSSFAQLVPLPNLTWDNRLCHAIKVGNSTDPRRPAVLFLGGVHGNEWGTPDILINLIGQLTTAYKAHTGITFGTRAFAASDIRTIVETIDLVVFPQVNPDGRDHSLAADETWRKNRRTTAPNSAACPGVDINRNFDIVWNFQTYFSPAYLPHTSANPCEYQVYHGPAAFSEPESRNVKWLIDNFAHIRFFIDLHAGGGRSIRYRWGLDEIQSVDPSMNFQNPAYDFQRGVGSDPYKEYFSPTDLATSLTLANNVCSAIQMVKGTLYTAQSSSSPYSASGTVDDYAYSRHLVDPSKAKVISFTIECGPDSHPASYLDMQDIIADVTCGLLAFCLQVCEIEEAMAWQITGNSGTVSTDFLGTTDLQPLSLGTNRKVRLRIAADGAIGIGTNNPTNSLEIKSSAQYAGVKVSNATKDVAILCGASSTNDDGSLNLYSGGVKKVQLVSNGGSFLNAGNVGIGTSNPTNKLEIKSSAQYTGVTVSNATKDVAILCGASPTNDDGSLNLYSGGVKKVQLVSNGGSFLNAGNVGIGTSNPLAKFEIKTASQYQGLLLSNATQNVAILCGASPTNDEGSLHLYSAGLKKVQLLSNGDSFFNGGNIAIGTSAASSSKVAVLGTSQDVAALRAENTGGGGAIAALANSGVSGPASVEGIALGAAAGVRGHASQTMVSSVGVVGTAGYNPVVPAVALQGGVGVLGFAFAGSGVIGIAGGLAVVGNGVEGYVTNQGAGVWGSAGSTTGAGVYGQNFAGGNAGRFLGSVAVNGKAISSGKAFRIDHPLQPSEKYLSHSSVECPDMMNVYNGNIVTDASGEAVVELPSYFEALNRDFKYQLTVIGEFAQVSVAREIEGHQFGIRTDRGNVKVSWQVTGVRQDPYAEANRILVEEEKSETERGRYLHPELFEAGSMTPDARQPIGWLSSMGPLATPMPV
jgi:carboxypeptidase T